MFNKIFQQQQLRKNLLAFLAEMEKNLELFYVMDQRQFITQVFLLDCWDLVKDEELVTRHESMMVYVNAIKAFNKSFKEHKEFEQWYTADMARKTPDNAKKLHALKHDLDKQLKSFEAIIILAGQDLEKEMLQLGMLKT